MRLPSGDRERALLTGDAATRAGERDRTPACGGDTDREPEREREREPTPLLGPGGRDRESDRERRAAGAGPTARHTGH